jgi:tetratricopeptide (TPR) repeat protein
VASLDFQIGLLMSELEQLGLRDTTLVVLTADHGEGLGEHGEPSHSFFVYDATMRVPLLLWGLDGLPIGKRISSSVRTLDILPTVLDLLGLDSPTDIQGVSLTPLVSGAKSDLALRGYGEATRFAATFGLPVLRSLRDGRWKYIHKVNPELYDVVADPHEQTNLALQHPETLARLHAELQQRMESAPPPPSDAQATVDFEAAAQLMALGYVAKGPELAVADDVASLELSGADPMTKVGDIGRIAEANGLLRRKEFEEALESLAPLRDANPDSPYVLGLFAAALRGQGRDTEAVAVLRRIRMLAPSDAEAAFQLARLLGGPSDSSDSLGTSTATAEAVEILDELLDKTPCDERFQLEQSRRLHQLARYADRVERLAQATESCPDMLSNLNNYAWALATLPDAELRDGAKAVQIMRDVIARAGEPDAAYQDTLAAALAEAGAFEEAIRTGAAALQRVEADGGPGPVVDELTRHLDAYRSGIAIRDPESS